MSDCGCETPAPPADIPIADSSCPCGLPEAFLSAESYTRETIDKLSRLWPYSEMYGPILREARQRSSLLRARREDPETEGEPVAYEPPPDDESPAARLVLPEVLYEAPNGVAPGTETGCEGWVYLGLAAPLMDPLGGTIAGCVQEAYLGWWLNATSPGTLRLGRNKTRIYVHNASLQSENEEGFPGGVRTSAGKTVKFAATAMSFDQLLEFWSALTYSQAQDVRDLHFSSQFVAFLDSEDGIQYPILAPLVLSTNSADPCDFGDMTPNVPQVIHTLPNGFRSGWRSTIIPCAGPKTVYQVDSVLCVCFQRRPLYLLFAVQCRGHVGQGSSQTTFSSGCFQCNPCRDGTEAQFTPNTRYVVFACRDPDFQEEVYGPFDLMEAFELPDASQDQWIGVPQAFLSPNGEFLFLYIVSRGSGQLARPGLRVASVDAFLTQFSSLLQGGAVAQGPAPLRESTRTQARGQTTLATAFTHLGDLEICPESLLQLGNDRVDEHFVFCDQRLHLFFALSEANAVDYLGRNLGRRLTAFWHATARMEYDSDSVRDYLEGSKPATIDVRDMCRRFEVTQCPPITTDSVFGYKTSSVPLMVGSVVTNVLAEINDPTVYPLRSLDTYQGYTGEPMVMLFGSAALRGLVVAASTEACGLGRCRPESSPFGG